MNFSKPVFSSNTTKRIICNASSNSQLVKPSTLPVCANNVTKRNVCNGSSVSQIVKEFNVCKPSCYRNATLSFVIPSVIALVLILLVIVSQLNQGIIYL